MAELRIGRHGVVLLALLVLLLGAEDIVVWVRSGELPAIEFFVGLCVVLVTIALAIYEANRHRLPHHR